MEELVVERFQHVMQTRRANPASHTVSETRNGNGVHQSYSIEDPLFSLRTDLRSPHLALAPAG